MSKKRTSKKRSLLDEKRGLAKEGHKKIVTRLRTRLIIDRLFGWGEDDDTIAISPSGRNRKKKGKKKGGVNSPSKAYLRKMGLVNPPPAKKSSPRVSKMRPLESFPDHRKRDFITENKLAVMGSPRRSSPRVEMKNGRFVSSPNVERREGWEVPQRLTPQTLRVNEEEQRSGKVQVVRKIPPPGEEGVFSDFNQGKEDDIVEKNVQKKQKQNTTPSQKHVDYELDFPELSFEDYSRDPVRSASSEKKKTPKKKRSLLDDISLFSDTDYYTPTSQRTRTRSPTDKELAEVEFQCGNEVWKFTMTPENKDTLEEKLSPRSKRGRVYQLNPMVVTQNETHRPLSEKKRRVLQAAERLRRKRDGKMQQEVEVIDVMHEPPRVIIEKKEKVLEEPPKEKKKKKPKKDKYSEFMVQDQINILEYDPEARERELQEKKKKIMEKMKWMRTKRD